MSPLLKRLEAAGLLTRDRDRDDERFLAVDLTEQGRALRRAALRIPAAVVDRLGMSLDELGALHAALTRVIAASAEASAVVAGPVPAPAPDPTDPPRRNPSRSATAMAR